MNAVTPAYAELIDAERHADRIHHWTNLVVPGLLQTPEYARDVISRLIHPARASHVDELVRVRLERQKILDGDGLIRLHSLIDEGVLRRHVGGPQVMHDQLRHLLEMSLRSTVTVQVVPLSAGPRRGMEGIFCLVDGVDGGLLYRETPAEGTSRDPADLTQAWHDWQCLRSHAFSEDATTALIRALLEET